MPLTLRVCDRLSNLRADQWDALVGSGSPFLEWAWLASLEDAGCVGASTGWLPQHLTLWNGDSLVAACPLYVKGNSQGEFVFDQGWADAAERAGLSYYPKLLVGVPFTPVTGARLLTHPAADRPHLQRTLGSALTHLCASGRFSSVHVNFCTAEDVDALSQLGFERRTGYQFQWLNPGWRTFDDYLAAFRSKRRVQIKRERRELDLQGIAITAHAGDQLDHDLFAPMFRLYRATIDKLYWGRQYLNEDLFELLEQRWRERLCLFMAHQGRTIVAGALTVRKGDALYGRYWGCLTELRHLHFNVCYYAPIEYCLREGVTRFEPGAGGEFKHLRGFEARPTDSMHFISDPRLAHAIKEYLGRERAAIAEEISWWDERSELKASRDRVKPA